MFILICFNRFFTNILRKMIDFIFSFDYGVKLIKVKLIRVKLIIELN
jgi:hypothetical protein